MIKHRRTGPAEALAEESKKRCNSASASRAANRRRDGEKRTAQCPVDYRGRSLLAILLVRKRRNRRRKIEEKRVRRWERGRRDCARRLDDENIRRRAGRHRVARRNLDAFAFEFHLARLALTSGGQHADVEQRMYGASRFKFLRSWRLSNLNSRTKNLEFPISPVSAV